MKKPRPSGRGFFVPGYLMLRPSVASAKAATQRLHATGKRNEGIGSRQGADTLQPIHHQSAAIFRIIEYSYAPLIPSVIDTSSTKEAMMMSPNRILLATLCLAALTLATPATAFADGHIEVSLSLPISRDALHPAVVTVRIENTGDRPVSIMKWDTPFVESGGRLPRSMFQVTDDAGNEVPYRGTWVNLGRLTMDSFKTVYPGEVLEKEVDLALEYRFQANATYKIKYVLPLDREPDPDVVSAAERAPFNHPVQSNAASDDVTISFADLVSSSKKSLTDDDSHALRCVTKACESDAL